MSRVVLEGQPRRPAHLRSTRACKAARSGRIWPRAVVDAGWNLNELRPVGLSLEEIFLQLTASEREEARAGSVREAQ